MHSTPASLLELARNPAEYAARVRFVLLYTPLLAEWSRRHHLQAADAEDLIQDVFAAVFTALPEFRYDPSRSFRAWLKTITLNTLRDRQRKKAPELFPNAAPQLAEQPDPAANPALLFEEEEYRRVVVGRALGLLEQEFAPEALAAFRRTALDGVAPAVAATELGLSVNSVYLARSRVLRRLRELLAGLVEETS
jgi:RNA polymerase sigma-70 factor (ECF subfamily)